MVATPPGGDAKNQKQEADATRPPGVERETHPTADRRTHFVALDAMRGIAILVVVLTHTSGYWFKTTRYPLDIPLLQVALSKVFSLAHLAVVLFFLLSGYLLAWTEEGRRDRGSYSILSYVRRRAFRLIPAYYTAIALILLLRPGNPTFSTLASHLTFLQGFVPAYPGGVDAAFWTLTPEIVFYAALPLIVLKLRKVWHRAAILAVLVALSLATRLSMSGYILEPAALNENFDGTRLFFFPTTLLYLFIVGMLLKMFIERLNASERVNRWQRPVALAFTIIPLPVLVAYPYLGLRQQQILQSPMTMLPEAMTIMLFVAALLGSPLLKPILRWRPLVFLGEISYSMFLLHRTILLLLTGYVLSWVDPWLEKGDLVAWTAFAAFAALMMFIFTAVSYLSYRFIESPFLRRKPK